MSIQFVACACLDCPMNEGKQCRAPFIFVDKNGLCTIKDNGPYDNKSAMERYVDLQECHCDRCRHWEMDEATQMGQCGFRSDLFFNKEVSTLVSGSGAEQRVSSKCEEFAKQIPEPGFSTTVNIPEL
jgi:hypothetical protein